MTKGHTICGVSLCSGGGDLRWFPDLIRAGDWNFNDFGAFA